MNYHHNPELSPQVEFNYLIQWFKEFSEFQKTQFLPILLDYMLDSQNGIYMNGICNSIASQNLKPMSLFECRIKLFREWAPKWPDDLRTKLIEKINDIDPDFGLELNQKLEEIISKQDIHENGIENGSSPSIEITLSN